jgi:hypothetical protein
MGSIGQTVANMHGQVNALKEQLAECERDKAAVQIALAESVELLGSLAGMWALATAKLRKKEAAELAAAESKAARDNAQNNGCMGG